MKHPGRSGRSGCLWFIGLWLAGVAALGLVALVMRFVLGAAGLRS